MKKRSALFLAAVLMTQNVYGIEFVSDFESEPADQSILTEYADDSAVGITDEAKTGFTEEIFISNDDYYNSEDVRDIDSNVYDSDFGSTVYSADEEAENAASEEIIIFDQGFDLDNADSGDTSEEIIFDIPDTESEQFTDISDTVFADENDLLDTAVGSSDIVDSGSSGDNLTWTLDDEGTLNISGEGDMVPYSQTNRAGQIVTTAPWGQAYASIRKIIISDKVTGIGNYAFAGCINLMSIDIPSSVVRIGEGTFTRCGSLTDITIPSSVTEIEDYTFNRCSSLTNIDIPSSVTGIGESAFGGCSSLVGIDIPSSVTSIGVYTFEGCSSLAYINIPSTVTGIGEGTFTDCSNLKEIDIPSSVTGIGEYAFNGCTGLAYIDIPSSVTSIGQFAFSGCSSMAGIGLSSSVTYIEESTFEGCSSLTEIDIPTSVTGFGIRAFKDCSSLIMISIPSSVTRINNGAFQNCTSLMTITIPGSVTYMGSNVFLNCSGLKKVFFMGDAPEFGAYFLREEVVRGQFTGTVAAVYYPVNNASWTESIKQTYYGGTVRWYFWNPETGEREDQVCGDNLIWELKDGVLTISGSGDMWDYNMPEDVPWFDDRLLIQEAVIGSEITRIGNYAFSGSNISSVVFPESIAEIGQSSFFNCSGLTAVTIPKSVLKIEDDAFGSCGNLALKGYTGSTAQAYAKDNGIPFTILDPKIQLSTPAKPVAAVQTSSVKLNWKAVKNAAGYAIYKKTGSGSIKKIATTTNRTYTDKGVKNGVVYRYYIQAVGKGNYTSSKKSAETLLTFLSVPGTLKVNSVKTKTATVTWKKNTKASGYQIRYSLKSNMVSAKTVRIAKAVTVKKVISKLTKRKNYYFQIRAYKTAGSKTYYSAWSGTKKVKVK